MNKASKRKKAISARSSDSTLPDDLPPEEDPATATIDVAAVEVPELTEQEQRDRLHLERRVERAFFEAGKALTELRDRRLYRSTHKTFEQYCRDRFGHSRQQSNYLIAAAQVYENLATNGCQDVLSDDLTTIGCHNLDENLTTNKTQILPTSERQVRPLTNLEPEKQQEVWLKAVVKAGGKVPTGKIVKDIVQQVMERTQVPNTYQLGEVCQILAKDNPDLKGRGGCWAIVSQVNQFSCTAKMWDGEYTVAVKHLKSFEYLPGECEQMLLVCDRITQLRGRENLEEAARAVLKHLGELTRPYLTEVEEKLLMLLESEYGT